MTAADKAAYRRAFKAADKGDWKAATRHAARAKDAFPRKILTWKRIVDGNSGFDFEKIVEFIDRNPAWPQRRRLRRRAEEAIDHTTPPEKLLAWFTGNAPVSGDGAFHHVRALLAAKRRVEATALARKAWIELDIGYRIERQFRKRYRKLLRGKDHAARLDRLLWDRRISAARRQLRRMSHDYQWLGLARIALMRRAPGVDYAVSKVPPALRADPGLIYERTRWRRKNRLYEPALDMMKGNPVPGVQPKRWWLERRMLGRWLLREGRIADAYGLIAKHPYKEGLAYAEAEWLAGWIALRGLKRPVDAFEHFKHMFDRVAYPVSRARAAYWAGRAAAAAGRIDIARLWYANAARHVTTYYGQLAAANLPPPLRGDLPSEPTQTPAEKAAFEGRELVKVVRTLAAIGVRREIDPFIRRLIRTTEKPGDWQALARLARESARNDLAVSVAKRAIRAGVVLGVAGYPDLAANGHRVPDPAFIKALVRQESAFDPKAISHQGARGLMQLMPRTAHTVARRLRLPYRRARLIRDPKYNITLGRAYLSGLLRDYNGSPILALAAYNAGPHRVKRWLKNFGDPGRSVEAAVDWIESIPIYETRNYVQRVLENFTVYRGRRDGLRMALSLAESLPPPKKSTP